MKTPSSQRHVSHQSNIALASSLALVLGLLACSGKLAVLKERAPGEPGSDPDGKGGGADSTLVGDPTETSQGDGDPGSTNSESPADSNVPFSRELADCPGLAPEPAYNGAPTGPEAPIECGTCSCRNGETVCNERECPPYKTMERCPSGDWAEARTWGGLIQGSTLFLNAQGYGGCNAVDLVPCYVPPEESTVSSQSRYPRQATLRVLNTTSESDCSRVVFRSLQIGLEGLEKFRSDQGNLVATNYGLAGLSGGSACGDAGRLAQDQFTHYLERSDIYPEGLRCETDADCIYTSFDTTCEGECDIFILGNQSSVAQLSAEMARIRGEVCTPAAESCSAMYPAPPLECDVLPSACLDHQCTFTE